MGPAIDKVRLVFSTCEPAVLRTVQRLLGCCYTALGPGQSGNLLLVPVNLLFNLAVAVQMLLHQLWPPP